MLVAHFLKEMLPLFYILLRAPCMVEELNFSSQMGNCVSLKGHHTFSASKQHMWRDPLLMSDYLETSGTSGWCVRGSGGGGEAK
jgi:hypothetical protein